LIFVQRNQYHLVKHTNNLNFIRLLLATLVLLSHSSELIDGDRHREILSKLFHTISFGELAVNGFFLLSGYLILQSWQRTPRLLRFLKKRFIRIYPGFIVSTIICAFLVGPLGAHSIDYFANFDVSKFLIAMFLLKNPHIPIVFFGQPHPEVNGSMWTISYEFRCYLIVAVSGILGIVNRRKLWLIFSIFVLISSVFPGILDKIYFPGLYYLIGRFSDFIRFLSFFCAGGCFYLFREQIRYRKVWVLAALPVVILSMFEPHILRLILPTVGGYIFFWFSFINLPTLQNFGTSSDISYGIYLYGWPIQKLLFWYFPSISQFLAFTLTLIISYGCGFLSWHLVEKPFLSLKN
jgi:peptidoglycan/LPS O-acetylase OafA/YrhL